MVLELYTEHKQENPELQLHTVFHDSCATARRLVEQMTLSFLCSLMIRGHYVGPGSLISQAFPVQHDELINFGVIPGEKAFMNVGRLKPRPPRPPRPPVL